MTKVSDQRPKQFRRRVKRFKINEKILLNKEHMRQDEALTRYLPNGLAELPYERRSYRKRRESKLKPPRDTIIRQIMRKFYIDGQKPYPLVDIGCNITAKFFSKDIMDVLYRSKYGGIEKLVFTGYNLSSSQANRSLVDDAVYFKTQEIPQLYYTAGVHPEFVIQDKNKNYLKDQIQQLLVHPQCVAVGQCGLDFYKQYIPPPYQENLFEKQIQMAIDFDKPLVVHSRDSGPRVIQILKKYRDQLKKPIIMHCFTGDAIQIEQLINMDAYIGITGWLAQVDFAIKPNTKDVLSLIKQIPQDRLLLETDSPFLIPKIIKPVDIRPRRNEPCFLQYLLPFIAEHIGKSSEEVALQSYKASVAAFGLI